MSRAYDPVLINWVNSSLLPPTVPPLSTTNLPSSCSDGVLLTHVAAQVLAAAGGPALDPHFLATLHPESTTVGKLRNFGKLSAVLSKLGVPLETGLLDAIATEKGGAAGTLLHRLRVRYDSTPHGQRLPPPPCPPCSLL